MTTSRLFITGTDTGVGKTHFTVWLARELQSVGLKVGAYKPACSGAVQDPSSEPEASAFGASKPTVPTWDDAERLAAALDQSWPLERIAPQCFIAPLAPPVAAALESREVDERLLLADADWWGGRVDALLIEGAGGWLSPISHNWTNADLAPRLNASVVLVAGNRLGVINHALLAIDAIARTSGLLGVVLNELSAASRHALPGFDPTQSNLEEIERRSGIRLWGTLSWGDESTLTSHGVPAALDWNKLLKRNRDESQTI